MLRHTVRAKDVIARLGGDEFGILTLETNQAEAAILLERIQQALINSEVEASIGYALRLPATGLIEALRQADRQMYMNKRIKQAKR